jgi:hypothetical protein
MSSVKFTINSSLLEYLNNEGKYLIEKRLDDSEELQKITTLQIGETYKKIEFFYLYNVIGEEKFIPNLFL